jgi:hypothetical protein
MVVGGVNPVIKILPLALPIQLASLTTYAPVCKT